MKTTTRGAGTHHDVLLDEGYPLLSPLLREITRLQAFVEMQRAAERRERLKVVDEVQLARVDWNGRQWWLTAAQREAVRALLDASLAGETVAEADLLVAAGVEGVGSIDALFAGVTDVEHLLVKGEGGYRLASPDEDEGDQGDDEEADTALEPAAVVDGADCA